MRNCATKSFWRIASFLVICAAVLRLGAATASFTWDPSPSAATGKVEGYKFYYSTVNFTSLPADVATNPAFTIISVTNGISVDLTDLQIGQTYFMAVTAFGSGQESLPSNVLTYTIATPMPSVTITSPAGDLDVLSTDVVTITAVTAGPNAITKVEFLDFDSLIATASTAPYTFTSAFTSGVHAITAKVTDVSNLTATSAPILIFSTDLPLPQNVPPTVAITDPANTAQFTTGQAVSVTATAADSDGAVSRVEFYDGSALIGTVTAVPYSVTLSSFSSGSHILTARAVDNLNAVSTSSPVTITVNPPANIPPTVALTSPVNNAQFTTGQSVTLTAAAADSDGTISRVDFFDGAALVGTMSGSPHSVVLSSLPAGFHTLTAKAVDNVGAVTTSAPITITVNPPANVPPTVALTSPANNAQFTTGQSVTLTAAAADSDGTISRVDLFDGAALIGTISSSPYSVVLSSLSPGSHILTAKAVDNVGAVTTSAPITITVNPPANVPPTVALTSPADNTQFTTGQSVTLTAAAADSDGTISRVDFFDGATLIGTSSSFPYSISISTLSSGSHTLTAKAVDNAGALTTSAPIAINVIVNTGNSLPVVSFSGLTEGALLSQPVALTVMASDADGSVVSVEFFANDKSLGSATSAPFVLVTSLLSGTYVFQAKATDNSGGTSFSSSITAIVKPAAPVGLTIK